MLLCGKANYIHVAGKLHAFHGHHRGTLLVNFQQVSIHIHVQVCYMHCS